METTLHFLGDLVFHFWLGLLFFFSFDFLWAKTSTSQKKIVAVLAVIMAAWHVFF